jgi:hypothetical protein
MMRGTERTLRVRAGLPLVVEITGDEMLGQPSASAMDFEKGAQAFVVNIKAWQPSFRQCSSLSDFLKIIRRFSYSGTSSRRSGGFQADDGMKRRDKYSQTQ